MCFRGSDAPSHASSSQVLGAVECVVVLGRAWRSRRWRSSLIAVVIAVVLQRKKRVQMRSAPCKTIKAHYAGRSNRMNAQNTCKVTTHKLVDILVNLDESTTGYLLSLFLHVSVFSTVEKVLEKTSLLSHSDDLYVREK